MNEIKPAMTSIESEIITAVPESSQSDGTITLDQLNEVLTEALDHSISIEKKQTDENAVVNFTYTIPFSDHLTLDIATNPNNEITFLTLNLAWLLEPNFSDRREEWIERENEAWMTVAETITTLLEDKENLEHVLQTLTTPGETQFTVENRKYFVVRNKHYYSFGVKIE